jgi:Usg-like family
LLQTYVWQDYDMFPNFPALKDFLAFWETTLDGPLFAVTVAHSKLIKPAVIGYSGMSRAALAPFRSAPDRPAAELGPLA